MTVSLTTTSNRTNFASCLMDAVALYLDGVHQIGSNRAEKFQRAKVRAADAVGASDNVEEIEMAEAIMLKIVDFEKRGLHV